MPGRQLEAGLQLDKWQMVWAIAINLVGADKDEHRIGRVLACCFKKVQRAIGVDCEVCHWFTSSPIVGGLSGAMCNDSDIVPVFGKNLPNCSFVTNIAINMRVVLLPIRLEQVGLR